MYSCNKIFQGVFLIINTAASTHIGKLWVAILFLDRNLDDFNTYRLLATKEIKKRITDREHKIQIQ